MTLNKFEDLQKKVQASTVLITGKNSDRFGTGFVIRQYQGIARVLTCAHVIEDVGGKEEALVDEKPVDYIVLNSCKELDLAILAVGNLWKDCLELSEDEPDPEQQVLISGWYRRSIAISTDGGYKTDYEDTLNSIEGWLDHAVQVGISKISTWKLHIGEKGLENHPSDHSLAQDCLLQPGRSGSPVVDIATGKVIGVVRQQEDEGQSGWAIAIQELQRIWRSIDPHKLYECLKDLGYTEQEDSFEDILSQRLTANAFLIRGESRDFGQDWLVKRLQENNLPEPNVLFYKIDLESRSQGSKPDNVWHALARQVRLTSRRKRLKPTASPQDIISRIYEQNRTNHIIFIFTHINHLSKTIFNRLIQEIWKPILNYPQENATGVEHSNRLMLFFVDYWNKFEEWDLDISKDEVVDLEKIECFSKHDLRHWFKGHKDLLPPLEKSPIEHIPEMVNNILELSESGVPTYAIQAICEECDYEYGELEEWLTL